MLRRTFHRLTTMSFVVFALLFSQVALAAYVCPSQADKSAMAGMMASGKPCEGMDQTQPVLCHQYSAAAAQSSEAVKLPGPAVPMVVQVLILPLVLQAIEAVAVPAPAVPEAHPPPDPIFLSTLRLRV